MKKLFSIGEVSDIKEITIKALRYYHKMGILIPNYIDETNGYRYYSIEQFIHIDIIKACRELGTSISELQEIFKDCDTDKLLGFLKVKRDEAEENINKMKDIINNIDKLNISVENSKEAIKNEEISVQYFEQRYIVVAQFKESGNLKELLYYSDLEKIIQNKEIEISMQRGIIYNFKLDRSIEPKYVFNEFYRNSNLDIQDKDDIKILPAGKYLTLSYSKYNEDERTDKIIRYIIENNIKVKEFIEIELFNDFFNLESYNCQIQILIENN